MLRQSSSRLSWLPNERVKEKNVTVLFLFQQRTGGLPGESLKGFGGAYLNWICCWLKWISPISQLLITRSHRQMGQTSERTLSLILGLLMCCGILGCPTREERGWERRMTLVAPHADTHKRTLTKRTLTRTCHPTPHAEDLGIQTNDSTPNTHTHTHTNACA